MTDTLGEPFKPGDSFHEMDPLIAPIVLVLREYGIDTVQSCQGGDGHSFPVPTVEFRGQSDQGYKAVHIALQRGLPICDLRRTWSVLDGELVGPIWEMTFTSSRLEDFAKDYWNYIEAKTSSARFQ